MTTTTHNVTCPKCSGSRFINGFQHIANGRCFECGGSGTIEITVEEVARRAADKELMARQIDFILTAPIALVERCTWKQIHKVWDIASGLRYSEMISDARYKAVREVFWAKAEAV